MGLWCVQVCNSDQPGFRLQSCSAAPQIKHPIYDVYKESLSSCGPNVVPSKLHPGKENQNEENFIVGTHEATGDDNMNGNVIIYKIKMY